MSTVNPATLKSGISFQAEFVPLIGRDIKTQTRRTMQPQPERCAVGDGCSWEWHPRSAEYNAALLMYLPSYRWREDVAPHESGAAGLIDEAPYHVGQRLYVKEPLVNHHGLVAYAADGANDDECDWHPAFGVPKGVPTAWAWKVNSLPGIYCPRAYSRYAIEITAVRAERVHDISEEDAKAEGFEGWYVPASVWNGEIAGPDGETAREQFGRRWEVINPGSWVMNPWAWVYNFKRIA